MVQVWSTMTWLGETVVQMLPEGTWPPNSPDMNVIEHLGPIVGRKLIRKAFRGPDELWAALLEAFASVTPDQVLRLHTSTPCRLAALKAAKVRHTYVDPVHT